MSGDTEKIQLEIPSEMMRAVDELQRSRYRRRSTEDICLLMIWRGLERTARLIQERANK